MDFYVYRPFEMVRDGTAISRDRIVKREFWKMVDEEDDGLSCACGCYIFIIRKKAWYIGMAEAQPFRTEIFQHHKLVLYSEALREVNGPAKFVFLAKLTQSGERFARPRKGQRDIQTLEKLMIGAALGHNPMLRNFKDTKLLREMHVPGLLQTGRGEGKALGVRLLREALGV